MPEIRTRNAAGQFADRTTVTPQALRKAWGIVGNRRLAVRRKSPALTEKVSTGLQNFSREIHFDAIGQTFTADKIDKTNGVIRGVSVITNGLIAKGHNLTVDDTTLKQMQACAAKNGQVPVKIDHKSGAASVCGYLVNFRQEDGKLKADWHLLQTHPQRDQILEVAERMPRGVGLSAAFLQPEKPEFLKNGQQAARCAELVSVDYVTLPAANPDGMFSAQSVNSDANTMDQKTLDAIQAMITAAVAPLNEKLTKQAEQIEALTSGQGAEGAEGEAEILSIEEAVGMTPEQLAKYGLTPEDVEAALAAALSEEDGSQDGLDSEADALAAEEGEDEGDDGADSEGADAAAATAGVTAGAPAAFQALERKVMELEAENERQRQAVKDAQEAVLFEEHESRVVNLVGQVKALKDQLSKAQKAGASPGVAHANETQFSTKEGCEFDRLVTLEVNKGTHRNKAFAAVAKANPKAHREWMVLRGLVQA